MEEDAKNALSIQNFQKESLLVAKEKNKNQFHKYFHTIITEFDPKPDENTYYLINKSSENVVAYVIAFHRNENCEIDLVVVHPEYQGKGVCGIILQNLLEELSCKTYSLINVGGKPAERCYEKVFSRNGYSIRWNGNRMMCDKKIN